jgi:2-polyprenyl-3-methyl-5-hydroxy-6-metoxy-1,4-benzoquinol methylase
MSTAIAAEPAADTSQRDALAQRLFEGFVAGTELLTIEVGLRLGLYQTLKDHGALSASEFAARAGIHERYAREWLEQQAVAGILDVIEPGADAFTRCFSLPAGHAEALLDPDSPAAIAATATGLAAIARVSEHIPDAYRSGGGIAFAEQGAGIRQSIGAFNRPMFSNDLAEAWLPALGDLHRRLQAHPSPRVLDIGCGTGWSTINLARAYPNARIEGLDLDHSSIEEARAHAERAGVADRVTFSVGDAAGLLAAERYDLVCMFETVHDMAHPIEALRRVRAALAPGAVVLIADERVAEAFTAPGDEIERLNYGWSVLHCLPATRAESPSVDAGTVLRPETLRRYAAEAGYSRTEVLPIENDFWRFYRLEAGPEA